MATVSTRIHQTIGAAAVAAGLVWCVMHPADSVAVDQGGAVGFCVAAMLVAGLWLIAGGWFLRTARLDRIDAAGLLMLAAVAGSGIWHATKNTTMAIGGPLPMGPPLLPIWSETLAWGAGVAAVLAARRISSRQWPLMLVAVGVLLSVWALHQTFISLPATLAGYEADPDGTLRRIGLDAPPGSRARVLFADRLRDGGPTASFALANTLAGALILPLAVAVGACLGGPGRAAGVLAAGLIGGAILAAGSTTGMISAALVIMSLLLLSTEKIRIITSVKWVLAALVVLVVGYGIAGGRLPVTLQYRLGYWQTSAAMLAAEPIAGVGPGLFRVRYPAFRDVEAHEVIADPHNFWVETAMSGGPVAAAALTFVLLMLVWRFKREIAIEPPAPTRRSDLLIWVAAGGAYMVAWVVSINTGSVFDLDPQLIGVPVALGLTWAARRSIAEVPSIVWPIGVAATLLHLSVSGGWTVPGVAAILAVGVAIGWPANISTEPPESRVGRLPMLGAVWILLVAAIVYAAVWTADAEKLVADPAMIKSVGQRELWQYQATGQPEHLSQARLLSAMALSLDPMDAGWMAQVAEIERRSERLQVDDPQVRRRLTAVIEHVSRQIHRKGLVDPVGNPLPLSRQLANIAEALGEAGGVYSRLLSFQPILPAEPFGRSAATSPVRRPADEVLGELRPSAAGQERGR